MTTGSSIASRRQAAGLSREALADQLGVSPEDVRRWESDEILPDADNVSQLCRILGISAGELHPEQTASDYSSAFWRLPLWRWFLRILSPILAIAGTAASLIGLGGAVCSALTIDQWYTDFGRFGTVLRTTWCGTVLPAGLLLLLIALALLVFDVLLSKRDCVPFHSSHGKEHDS